MGHGYMRKGAHKIKIWKSDALQAEDAFMPDTRGDNRGVRAEQKDCLPLHSPFFLRSDQQRHAFLGRKRVHARRDTAIRGQPHRDRADLLDRMRVIGIGGEPQTVPPHRLGAPPPRTFRSRGGGVGSKNTDHHTNERGKLLKKRLHTPVIAAPAHTATRHSTRCQPPDSRHESAFAPSVSPWSPRFRSQPLHLCATVSCSWCIAIHRVGGIPTAGTSLVDMSSQASCLTRPSVGNAAKNSVSASTTPYPSR